MNIAAYTVDKTLLKQSSGCCSSQFFSNFCGKPAKNNETKNKTNRLKWENDSLDDSLFSLTSVGIIPLQEPLTATVGTAPQIYLSRSTVGTFLLRRCKKKGVIFE
jgi:hypothetical protein